MQVEVIYLLAVIIQRVCITAMATTISYPDDLLSSRRDKNICDRRSIKRVTQHVVYVPI